MHFIGIEALARLDHFLVRGLCLVNECSLPLGCEGRLLDGADHERMR